MDTSMKKHLKLVHVFSIASGAMISSGIFILPGIAFAGTGPSLFLSYGLAGIVALIGVLSIIELATAMPKAGGDYYFIGRTFGPLLGTVMGTLSWFALSMKSAFAVFGLSEILYLLTGANLHLLAGGITLAFVLLNIVGVKETAALEVALVAMLMVIMALFIGIGAPKVDPERYSPFFTHGFNGMIAVSAFVFVSFGGLLQVATIAEEVKRPQEDIRRGTLLAVFAVTLLYMGTVAVTTGLLPAERLSGSLTPVADAASLIVGRAGWTALSVAAALAFVTTALAGIMSASRYPLALARDGLLPSFMGRIGKRTGTPAPSVAATGLLVFLALLLDLDVLVKSASAVFMISYIFGNLAVIVLRESGLENYKPLFRAPFYPWAQALAILIYLFLLADMGWESFAIALGFIALSLSVYAFYGRHRASHDYALVHLLKRVVDARWREEGLDRELMDIIHRRDRRPSPTVAEVLENLTVRDLDGGVADSGTLFREAAREAAASFGLEAGTIAKALAAREAEVTTALTGFTAVPHMVLPDEEHRFGLFAFRSRTGIAFGDERPAVKAVFVCAGSGDVKDVHLETLAAVARTVRKPDFEGWWLDAGDEKALQERLRREMTGKRKKR